MNKKICIIMFIPFLIWIGIRIIADIQFTRNCGGYLKRSADANTVKMAKQELERAFLYIEKEKLTNGYTSVFWKTPDEDIGFWHDNLKSALEELNSVGPNATQLEKSNILMKLRETLLDSDDKKMKVTFPKGIGLFPYNFSTAIFGTFSCIIAIIGGIILFDEI